MYKLDLQHIFIAWCFILLETLFYTSAVADTINIVTPTVDKNVLVQYKAESSQWNLSVEEWTRYQSLLPLVKHHLTNPIPYAVLALFPENPADRARYMEQMAKMEHEFTQRLALTDQAYEEAYARLFPGTTHVSQEIFSKKANKSSALGFDRRYAIFLKTENCQKCNAFFQTIKSRLPIAAPLDIYFIGASKDNIIKWANQNKIDADLLSSKLLTLNIGDKNYLVYNKPPIPSAFVYDEVSKTTSRVVP